MNQIPSNSLDNILQEILETPELKPQCSCHIINPRVHRLILWVNPNQETGTIDYTLRIGSQRFTSVANTDKLGQTYWLFQVAGYYADGQTTIKPELINENTNTNVQQQTTS